MDMLLDMDTVQEETRSRDNSGKHHSTDYILDENTPFAINEAYKALRTNLIFSIPDEGAKVIGVTSASRGEGKSTVTLNLAVSFAQLGKKVLLLDCDLRLPTVAEKLGIKGLPGLSDLLVAKECPIRYMKELGIYVLPSGTQPPDATALLSSTRMDEVIAEAREKFDYIFLDLPPVTTVADATILSKRIDGFLLVVKRNYSRYGAISDTLNQLELVDARVLGYVYTSAEASGGYYKYYGRSYGKN